MEAGIEDLTQAAGLCEHGSELHARVLALLCQATIAEGGGGASGRRAVGLWTSGRGAGRPIHHTHSRPPGAF